MRACPFCGFDEGWTRDFEGGFKIECNVCGGAGPKSTTRDGAEKKWNGYLTDLDTEGPEFNAGLAESDMGGVSAPMSTVNNTPGVGTAQPAAKAAMTGSQQNSPDAKGSGDKWDETLGMYTQDGKKKKKKDTNENNISPFDEIGKMMAKRMKVPMYFEKGKDQSVKHVKQKNVEEGGTEDYTYHVATLNDFKGNKKKKK